MIFIGDKIHELPANMMKMEMEIDNDDHDDKNDDDEEGTDRKVMFVIYL